MGRRFSRNLALPRQQTHLVGVPGQSDLLAGASLAPAGVLAHDEHVPEAARDLVEPLVAKEDAGAHAPGEMAGAGRAEADLLRPDRDEHRAIWCRRGGLDDGLAETHRGRAF